MNWYRPGHCLPCRSLAVKRSSSRPWFSRNGTSIWFLLIPLALTSPVDAQLCVSQGGREACVSHVIDASTGKHTWRLWTDHFRQVTELDTLGGDTLGYRLTEFNQYAGLDTMQWCPDSGFVGEYELQYAWSASENDTVLLRGSTADDGFIYSATTTDYTHGPTPWVQLCVRFLLQHADSLALELFYRGYLDGYLERWARVTNLSDTDTLLVFHLASFRRQFLPPGWKPNDTTTRWQLEWVLTGQTSAYRSNVIDSTLTSLALTSWENNPVGWFAVGSDLAQGSGDGLSWERTAGFILGLVQPSVMYTRPFAFHIETPDAAVDTLDVWTYNQYATRATDKDRREPDARDSCILPRVVPPLMSLEDSHAYFGFTDGTLHDASARTHGFIRSHHVPPAAAEPDSFPRTEFLTFWWNPWSFTYDSLSTQAAVAHELGLERFVIDANWNRFSLSARPSGERGFYCFCHGSGYWVSDSCRFDPQTDGTLVDFIDELQSDSREVGLWIYPASVDTTLLFSVPDRLVCWGKEPPDNPCFCDSIPLACEPWDTTWHTEFYPGESPGCLGDRWWLCPDLDSSYTAKCPFVYRPYSHIGELCCAHDSARTWMRAQLERLIDPDLYGAAYLKFDGGMHPCMSENHSHRMELFPGDTARMRVQEPVEGGYQLLGEILEEYPGTILEIGWPVGHIEVVEDPNTGSLLPYQTRYSRESHRWFTLPQYAGGYFYAEPTDTLGLSDEEKLALRNHYIRTNMLGPFKISCDLTKLSPPFVTLLQDGIEYYKDNRRFLRGECYNVLRQGEMTGVYVIAQDSSWDAVEFLDPQEGDARVFVFRTQPAMADSVMTVKLLGLEPDTTYVVEGVDLGAPIDTVLGQGLMEDGLEVHLPHLNSSEILEVTPLWP